MLYKWLEQNDHNTLIDMILGNLHPLKMNLSFIRIIQFPDLAQI